MSEQALTLPMPTSRGAISAFDSDEGDPAIPAGRAPQAILSEPPAPVTLTQSDEDALSKILGLSTKEARDATEFDPKQLFYAGIRKDAPFDNFVIAGISFERHRGLYDQDTKMRTIQLGRTVELSPRLAALIRKRAKEIHVECEYGYDAQHRPFIRRVIRQIDLRKTPESQKLIENRPATYNSATQLKATEWFPVERFIVLEDRADLPVTEFDGLSAENRKLIDENARLRDENAALVKRMNSAQ